MNREATTPPAPAHLESAVAHIRERLDTPGTFQLHLRADEAAALLARLDALERGVSLAYGCLWHVNNEPAAPIPTFSPEQAAYQARRLLRDLLTHERRGDAINAYRNPVPAAEGEKS